MKENISNQTIRDFLSKLAKLDVPILLSILGHCCFGLEFYSSVCGKLKKFQILPTLPVERKVLDNDKPVVGLMGFDNLDCLCLVKRPTDRSSIEVQVRNELLAYEKEYGLENKTAILLVLGGETHPFEVIHDNHPVLNAMVFYCPWRKMKSVVEAIIRNRDCSEYRDQLILDEIKSSLEHMVVGDEKEDQE